MLAFILFASATLAVVGLLVWQWSAQALSGRTRAAHSSMARAAVDTTVNASADARPRSWPPRPHGPSTRPQHRAA